MDGQINWFCLHVPSFEWRSVGVKRVTFFVYVSLFKEAVMSSSLQNSRTANMMDYLFLRSGTFKEKENKSKY